MNSTRTNQSVTTIIASMGDHWTRPTRTVGQEGQLSIFTCSCGKEFVPSEVVENPRQWHSLPRIHQALELAIALGDAPVLGSADAATAPIGSVFVDSRGVLYRKYDHRQWRDESAKRFDEDPDNSLVAHVWSPAPAPETTH